MTAKLVIMESCKPESGIRGKVVISLQPLCCFSNKIVVGYFFLEKKQKKKIMISKTVEEEEIMNWDDGGNG